MTRCPRLSELKDNSKWTFIDGEKVCRGKNYREYFKKRPNVSATVRKKYIDLGHFPDTIQI